MGRSSLCGEHTNHGTKGANLTKLEEEDFIKIITGAEPVDYFDTFVDNWHNQGGNEILDEIEEELTQQE